MSGDTVPAPRAPTSTVDGAEAGDTSLTARARRMLDAHWQPRGYTVPNAAVYPHQWLWDSCFHAVVWAHLGAPERATAELTNLLAAQHDDGFVPHMTYWDHPDLHATFWGRRGTSGITQPPMYGHAIAELVRLGVPIDPELARRAAAGLDFLLGPRRGERDLVPIVHPWESGCDDSPRWEAWAGAERSVASWRERKGELVASIVRSASGSPLANPLFEVTSSAFNALVAFNAIELAAAGFGHLLVADVEPLVAALDRRWDPDAVTWRDHDDDRPVPRTLEALLPVLVTDDDTRIDAVFTQIVDDDAYGGRCGPAQVHRHEPAFDPAAYWRGPAWPQLTYLVWLAARRHRRREVADALAASMLAGVESSGFAEYWHADSGEGFGAVPQSWAALAVVMPGATR